MSIERARADLATLEQAIARLRAELAEAEERATRIRTYIELSDIYGRSDSVVSNISDINLITKNRGGRPRTGNGIVERAQNAVKEFLQEAHHPIHTSDLLGKLADRGIIIGSAKPQNNLSGMLSRSKLFKSGRYGWSLPEWDDDISSSITESPNDNIKSGNVSDDNI